MDVFLLFLLLTCLAFYFLRTIIDLVSDHQRLVPILRVNLFLGWTFVGWVVALVWAAMPVKRGQVA